MRYILFFIATLLPTYLLAQSYTECETSQGRLYCEHNNQNGLMPRIDGLSSESVYVNPADIIPRAQPVSSVNHYEQGRLASKAEMIADQERESAKTINQQDQELKQLQIDYYRKLNQQLDR